LGATTEEERIMKKSLCLGLLTVAFIACHNERDVRAGDRGDNIGAQMSAKPGTPPPVKPEALMSKDSVAKVQEALADRGFVVEKTGTLDARTQTALRSFQRREGMTATGMPDQMTLRRLNLDPNTILRPQQPTPDRMDRDDSTTEDYNRQNR
jgi:peptidoglycan hydrolase-like protein with peptidoglycan-binding domain